MTMSIAAGARIGSYEVVAAIGAGGMGEGDGRFLFRVVPQDEVRTPMTVILNWASTLKNDRGSGLPMNVEA